MIDKMHKIVYIKLYQHIDFDLLVHGIGQFHLSLYIDWWFLATSP